MKYSRLPLMLFVLIVVCAALSAAQVIERPKEGTQYETLTLRIAENLRFENPFDLETNHVELHVRLPDHSNQVLSFFFVGLNEGGTERWEARFAPGQAGLHHFTIVVKGEVREQFDVLVKPHRPERQGGLRLSDRFGAFRFESGKAFRGIGLNVCWAGDYEYYFKKMHDAGINVTRIWMCPWNLSFEWKETGLGRYSLETARRLDTILKLAERYGIFVILCMDYHGIGPKGLGYFKENRWLANPYNKVNGGPCVTAEELFTSLEAKKYFQRKYKYIISRFGHSPNIAAWEFMNEADLMAGRSIQVNRWHIEMAEYIKSIDVHHRLVSSSSTRKYMEKLVDAFKSPAMDFVMFHDYNSLNLAPHFTDLEEATIDYYQKPVVLGEFGVEFRGGDRTIKADSQHIGLHNGIWAGWFSETPIIPMSWWWESYIDQYNLWWEYASLSRFANSMDGMGKHLVFKTLDAGLLKGKTDEQAPCLVRCIYFGEQCALWLKNLDYQWALISEGGTLHGTGEFSQIIPGLVPGRYSVAWYEPQTGQFSGKPFDVEVKGDGKLALSVPSIMKDLACLLTRKP